jgi:hypothetical protein
MFDLLCVYIREKLYGTCDSCVYEYGPCCLIGSECYTFVTFCDIPFETIDGLGGLQRHNLSCYQF